MFQAIEKKHGLPAGLRRILYIFCVLAILGDTMWSDGITLGERYAMLPKGFMNMFVSGNGGFGLLFVLTTANYPIIRHISDIEGKPMLSLFHWILLFSAIYIILLPFGGYRPYRPLIIRYDSALPVSCLFIFYYVHSSVFLLKKTQCRSLANGHASCRGRHPPHPKSRRQPGGCYTCGK